MARSPQVLIPRRGRHIAEDYNVIKPEDSNRRRLEKIEMFVAKRLGTRLTKLYPRRAWSVEVDLRGGVVIIQCPDVSTMRGHVLKLSRSVNELENMMSQVGGEILERGGLTRGRTTEDIVESAARDFKDELVDLENA